MSFISLECHVAHATLGEREESVDADRRAISGVRRNIVARSSYSVHEIANDGITIREYASPDGMIFAVAWKGIHHPDLTPLLGSYFAEFRDASRASVRSRGHRFYGFVQAPRVVVEKFGHMRGLQGKAYVPALIPQGVNLDEIQ